MASIAFTDSVGAATLTNGKPTPASRFAAWHPLTDPYGEAAHRQSDRKLSFFELGSAFGASFELRGIPVKTTSGARLVDVADRLRAHLIRGGTCSVATDDVESNSYTTCSLAPGTRPELRMTDPAALEYTLSVSLIDVAAVPARMVCHYAA